MMIGTRERDRISLQTSMPDTRGSITSSSTTAGFVASNTSRASVPSAAVTTPNPLVAHLDDDLPCAFTHRHVYGRARLRVLHGVVEQVHHGADQLAPVAP